MDSKSCDIGTSMPCSLALVISACAIGCSASRWTDAATRSTSSSVSPSAAVVFTTRCEPRVSVPVLSNTTVRSEEHTSDIQSLMRISYAVFCLKKQNTNNKNQTKTIQHE